MLGNITPGLTVMPENGKRIYKSYYCGVCKEICRRYGNVPRAALSYETVFFALLYDAVSDEEAVITKQNCIFHPFKKRDMCSETVGISLRADLQIILTYAKLGDSLRDETGIKKALRQKLTKLTKKHYEKLKYIYLELCRTIEEQNLAQAEIEKQNPDTDGASMPTAEMTKAIIKRFFGGDNIALNNFRFFLGRFIYLLDALTDRKADAKSGSFNVFNQNGADTDGAARECYLALSELSYWYSRLDLKRNADVLDSLIYTGFESRIMRATKGGDENGEQL